MTSTGYVRQSSAQIASGQQVTSSCFNNEFNQLQAAFSETSGHAHDGTTGGGGPLSTGSLAGLSNSSIGIVSVNGVSGFSPVTITGTSNQITVTNGTGAAGNPTIAISGSYVGQASITTLGTIATGVWQGTVVGGTYGGTGHANSGVLTYGSNNLTFTTSGATSVTLPTSGTLLSSANNLSDVSAATTALNNILPTQSTHANQFLKTDGAGNVIWAAVSGASGGTVTSVTFTGDGTILSSTPSSAVTSSGTLAATLNNATGGTVLGNSSGSSTAPSYISGPVLGINTTTTGTIGLANGGASGATVTLKNTQATAAYNFILPSGVGTAGQFLTSQAGGTSPMTWTTPSGSSGISYSAGAFTLSTISSNTVMANTTGGSASPTGNTISAVLNLLGSVKGELPYVSSTSTWSALAIGSTGQVLTVSGGVPAWATALSGIGKVSVQTFTTSGTYTPTSGTTFAIVEMVGGGGGGGGGSSNVGSGGGAGGYLRALLTAAQIGASKAVTIGAAGAAGATGGGTGGTGGTTSMSTLLSCTGGVGGVDASNAGSTGGVGGSATVTTGTTLITMAGKTGGMGAAISLVLSGCGADSPLGNGGNSVIGDTSAVNAPASTGFGAGGAGAKGISATAAAGTAGCIIVTEYQ